MKKHFRDYAPIIWNQIMGMKGLGISSRRTEGLVNILERELKLKPIMVRVNDKLHLYTTDWFVGLNITSLPDGSVTVFYLPLDCEETTGSQAQNWTQWSSNLLGYKRKSHKMALRVRPPVEVLDVLAQRGITKGRRRLDFRFLSLELVIFYIAAQTRTWRTGVPINTVKDLIEKHDISTRGYTPAHEEIDVDDLFPNDGAKPSPVRPSGVPKAGQGLVSYIPSPAKDHKSVTIDPVEELLGHLTGSPIPKDESPGMTDMDPIDQEMAAAKKTLEELIFKKRTRKFAEEAMRGKMVGGEPWPDAGQWALVHIEFPNGNRRTYLDSEIVTNGMGMDTEKLVEEARKIIVKRSLDRTSKVP